MRQKVFNTFFRQPSLAAIAALGVTTACSDTPRTQTQIGDVGTVPAASFYASQTVALDTTSCTIVAGFIAIPGKALALIPTGQEDANGNIPVRVAEPPENACPLKE